MSRSIKQELIMRIKPSSKSFDETKERVLKKGGKVRHDSDDGHWIQDAIKKPGALHKELKIPMDKKIPEKKILKAEHSKNPLLRKRANLAATLKKMHKK